MNMTSTSVVKTQTPVIAAEEYLKYIYDRDSVLYQKDKIINQQTKTINELIKTVNDQRNKNDVVNILTTTAAAAGAVFALYTLFNKSS